MRNSFATGTGVADATGSRAATSKSGRSMQKGGPVRLPSAPRRRVVRGDGPVGDVGVPNRGRTVDHDDGDHAHHLLVDLLSGLPLPQSCHSEVAAAVKHINQNAATPAWWQLLPGWPQTEQMY